MNSEVSLVRPPLVPTNSGPNSELVLRVTQTQYIEIGSLGTNNSWSYKRTSLIFDWSYELNFTVIKYVHLNVRNTNFSFQVTVQFYG